MSNISIYQIAEATGYSSSTVARALRENGVCSPKTRAEIIKAAEMMGYVPNRAARTLRNNLTGKIMLSIPDIYNSYYFGMIRGVNEALEQNDYYPILCPTYGSLQKEGQMLHELKSHMADGMIMASFNFCPALMNIINDCEMPVVIVNHVSEEPAVKNYDCVTMNTEKGIYLGTSHLIQNGHTSIAYVGGNPDTQVGRERMRGYLAAMADAGLPPFGGYDSNAGFNLEGGLQRGLELLGNERPPTAVMAANDLMALGVMRACEMYGVRIPEDLCLVGMDNSDLAQSVRPALTSVTMKEDEVGWLSATLLLDRIKNKRQKHKYVLLEPSLVVRPSSSLVRGR